MSRDGHIAAAGVLSGNEATGNTGVHMTRGGLALAQADEERRQYLEAHAEEWRRESRETRRKMGLPASYQRKDRRQVPA